MCVHIGQLLGICSIKHYEMPEAMHLYMGRWCFQAPKTRDESGRVERAAVMIDVLKRAEGWVDLANRVVCEETVSSSSEGRRAATSCLSEGSHLVLRLLRLGSECVLAKESAEER